MRCSASAGIGAGRSSIVKSAVRAGPWRSLSVGGPQNRRLRPGAKGHTAASHWALRGSMARPECVARSLESPPQEARAVGSGATKRSVATVDTRQYGGAGASGPACASRDLHACRMCRT